MRSLREWFGGRIQWLVGLIVLFAIIVCGIYMGLHVWQEYRTPPEERVAEALHYAVNATEYTYVSEAVRIHDGVEQVITHLKGEKSGDNVHLYGMAEVLNTEINIYQIGDTFYRQDVVSGQWQQMIGQNLEATQYLIQEIHPLGCLNMQDTFQVVAQGKEKANGVSCKKYQVQSNGESTFLTSVWKEFYYTVWIDKKHRLQQVELIADDHEDSLEQLHLTIQFDWDTNVEPIEAPI